MTQDKLKSILIYDKETGVFTRIKGVQGALDKRVKCVDKDGYIVVQLEGKKYRANRLAWLYEKGENPTGVIDHINQDKKDNRIKNLRDISILENHRNLPIQNNNTSGVTGVGRHSQTKRWLARIKVKGKTIHLGYFDNKDDAIKARKEAEAKYGFHKNHGRAKQ